MFENHVAHYWFSGIELGCRVERILFRAPNTTTDMIEFLSIRGDLIVRGDRGEAIYSVYNPQTMAWWGNTDACYLSKKLMDLDGHASPQAWDSNKAKAWLAKEKAELETDVRKQNELLFEEAKDSEPDLVYEEWIKTQMEGDRLHYDMARLKAWLDSNPEEYCESLKEWEAFLSQNGQEVMGDEYWLKIYIGVIQHPTVGIHLDALKQSLKQLKDKGIKLYVEPQST